MTNQLQKDIKTALKWYNHYPYSMLTHEDVKTQHRLSCYAKKDINQYTKLEMKKLIEEALKNERTEIGQSVLKQLLERIQ